MALGFVRVHGPVTVEEAMVKPHIYPKKLHGRDVVPKPTSICKQPGQVDRSLYDLVMEAEYA
jgi:hypothetical protein